MPVQLQAWYFRVVPIIDGCVGPPPVAVASNVFSWPRASCPSAQPVHATVNTCTHSLMTDKHSLLQICSLAGRPFRRPAGPAQPLQRSHQVQEFPPMHRLMTNKQQRGERSKDKNKRKERGREKEAKREKKITRGGKQQVKDTFNAIAWPCRFVFSLLLLGPFFSP